MTKKNICVAIPYPVKLALDRHASYYRMSVSKVVRVAIVKFEGKLHRFAGTLEGNIGIYATESERAKYEKLCKDYPSLRKGDVVGSIIEAFLEGIKKWQR